jgi:hypothetical protein
MRTAYSVSPLLLFALLVTSCVGRTEPPATDSAKPEAGKTAAAPENPSTLHSLRLAGGKELRLSVNGDSTEVSLAPSAEKIQVHRDDTVAPNGTLLGVELVAEAAEGLAIVRDKYASRPQGLSMCQAGEEEFLRVFKTAPRLEQTFVLKLQSCIATQELKSPGIAWNPEKSTLGIAWLTPPKSAVYKIDNSGAVKVEEP